MNYVKCCRSCWDDRDSLFPNPLFMLCYAAIWKERVKQKQILIDYKWMMLKDETEKYLDQLIPWRKQWQMRIINYYMILSVGRFLKKRFCFESF